MFFFSFLVSYAVVASGSTYQVFSASSGTFTTSWNTVTVHGKYIYTKIESIADENMVRDV